MAIFIPPIDFRIPAKPPQINNIRDAQAAINELYNFAQQLIIAISPVARFSKAPLTLATLPAANSISGQLSIISDGISGKWLVYSNGTNWLYTDGSIAL